MIKQSKICFFTGHRIIAKGKQALVESWLRRDILDKINHQKTTEFITGGALGFDTMAAEQVIALREDYDFIKLSLYLPCKNQDANWSSENCARFRRIMELADSVHYITDTEHTRGCMRKRNQAMVDASTSCIAYLINPRSGSAQTVKMAEKKGIDIINIAEKMLTDNQ